MIFPLEPIPPVTIKAPVLALVLAVLFVIDTCPLDVKPVNVPTVVILVWLDVKRVPVKLVAVNELILLIFLLGSKIKALLASAVPIVTISL